MATEPPNLSSATSFRTGFGAHGDADWAAVNAVLATCNNNRLSGARDIRKLELMLRFIACVLTFVAVVGALRLLTAHIAVVVLILGLFSLHSIQTYLEGRRRKVQRETCRSLLPLLLDPIDNAAVEFGLAPDAMSRMPGYYFLPRQQARYDVLITGEWCGTAFSVGHCEFTVPAGENADQVTFSGVIACVALRHPFPGDFAALQRPEKPRSLLRQTMLPDRLKVIQNEATYQRSAYEFVSTAPDVAEARLGYLIHTIDALGIVPLDAVAQIGVRSGDVFLLLPSSNSPLALPDVSVAIDIDRDLKPFRECLWSILRVAQTACEI